MPTNEDYINIYDNDKILYHTDKPTIYVCDGDESSVLNIIVAKHTILSNIIAYPDLNSDQRSISFALGGVNPSGIINSIPRRDYSKTNWSEFKRALDQNIKM